MPAFQEQFDDAMFEFSLGHIDAAITALREILAADPNHFEAQLALGGACYGKGDYATAILEGHKAEKLKPEDPFVHTNLSRAYLKAGDKAKAEHHAMRSKISSWRGNMAAPAPKSETELEQARPPSPPTIIS